MRLTRQQQTTIKRLAEDTFGRDVVVLVFGSRADDTQKGGDLDLLIKTDQRLAQPTVVAARLSAQISRLMDGRKVDVILQTPTGKRLPIHTVAERTGQRLV